MCYYYNASYSYNIIREQVAYPLPLGNSIAASSVPIDHTLNTYPAPEPFSSYNGNLALPLSREYSSGLRVNRSVTYTVPVSRAMLESAANTSEFTYVTNSYNAAQSNYVINLSSSALRGLKALMGQDLAATATASVRHKLSSAGYYQYLNLTVEYPPGISVFNIASSPIVESFSHDAEANSIAVIFRDYDSPYEGPVLTYTLVTEDGKQRLETLEVK